MDTYLRHVSVPVNLRIWKKTMTLSTKRSRFKQKEEMERTRDIGDDESDEDGIGENQSESEGQFGISKKFGGQSRGFSFCSTRRCWSWSERHGWSLIDLCCRRLVLFIRCNKREKSQRCRKGLYAVVFWVRLGIGYGFGLWTQACLWFFDSPAQGLVMLGKVNTVQRHKHILYFFFSFFR